MNNGTRSSLIQFGSKAYTLHQLENISLSCTIPPILSFNLEEWETSPDSVIKNIQKTFKYVNVAVRSSALCEDGILTSHAGAFSSVLNVSPQDVKELDHAIEKVFASYPTKNLFDQILVQEMVEKIDASGVILTRCVDDGSPYYVLNYDDESGSSESITSGVGVHKTVMVYRHYKPEYCDSKRVKKMLELAKEIEEICGPTPLDIEFALDKMGAMHLLQVRRISTSNNWHPDAEFRVSRMIPHVEHFVSELSGRRKGLYGSFTIFGNMPDWNPAELIGVIPSTLAASLFRFLISSHTWSLARVKMGYREIPKTELMVMIGGRTFIDVRASFNSLLPKDIPDNIGEKLIRAWLERLQEQPSLHDKIEFEVANTVLDFSFEKIFSSRYKGVLDADEKGIYKQLLLSLTNKIVDISEDGSLCRALSSINSLDKRQRNGCLSIEADNATGLVAHINGILQDCIQNGTIPFSILARHAFVAETFLRSIVERAAISNERIEEFKSSFKTIMGDLANDTFAVCEGTLSEDVFYNKYGHLRPGTFDILSPTYRDRADLFSNCFKQQSKKKSSVFLLSKEEINNLNRLLTESGITNIDANGIFEYAKLAIQGREFGKFIFSRSLSAVLEYIAEWGGHFNLGREDLSYLDIQDILNTCYSSSRSEITSMLMQKVDQARIDQSLSRVFKLSYLIRGVRDIHIVPVHRSEPNFITQDEVEGASKFLQPTTVIHGNLEDAIVCIENADPGFDWIFTKGIKGLITKYGGANSHMAIRCAELKLPAAIGCGEEQFDKLTESRRLNLNCATKTIRIIGIYE